MNISLVRIEGNRYAAFIIDSVNKELLMFLGYHFTYENKTTEDILQQLQAQLFVVAQRITNDN